MLLWAVFSITSVHAEGATGRSTESATQDKTVWIVTLGGGTEYGPSYEGASNQSFSFVPYFDVRRFGEPPDLSPPDDNLDYSLIRCRGFELGPVAGYRGDRSTSDDGALEGLHDIGWSVDAGIFAQYWLVPDRFRLRVEG